MPCTSSTYRGCHIHTECVREGFWLAYVLESCVSGAGDTPTAAIANMIKIMDPMPNHGIDVLPRGSVENGPAS